MWGAVHGCAIYSETDVFSIAHRLMDVFEDVPWLQRQYLTFIGSSKRQTVWPETFFSEKAPQSTIYFQQKNTIDLGIETP